MKERWRLRDEYELIDLKLSKLIKEEGFNPGHDCELIGDTIDMVMEPLKRKWVKKDGKELTEGEGRVMRCFMKWWDIRSRMGWF